MQKLRMIKKRIMIEFEPLGDHVFCLKTVLVLVTIL